MHNELVGVGEVWASLKNYEEKESGDIMIPGEVGLAVSCQLGLRSARDVPLSAPVLPPNLCKGETSIQLTGRPTACWPFVAVMSFWSVRPRVSLCPVRSNKLEVKNKH